MIHLATGADYSSESSTLAVHINRICYKDPAGKYVKVKLTLYNKTNGIVYETCRNYKLKLEDIKHWKRFYD